MMMRKALGLVLLTFFLGCSSREKLEVPKDAKPAPTSQPFTMGGGGGTGGEAEKSK